MKRTKQNPQLIFFAKKTFVEISITSNELATKRMMIKNDEHSVGKWAAHPSAFVDVDEVEKDYPVKIASVDHVVCIHLHNTFGGVIR